MAPSCAVVTARHILLSDSGELYDKASVRLQSGQVVPAEVEYEVESKDLVVLRPTRAIGDCQELPLSATSPRPGEAVLILGYPDMHPDSGISAVPAHVINTDSTDSIDFLLLGFVTIGSSGGPIVNTDGEVVGLVWGQWAVDRDADGNWIYTDYLIAGVDVSKHLR